jgi:hypothetical protein
MDLKTRICGPARRTEPFTRFSDATDFLNFSRDPFKGNAADVRPETGAAAMLLSEPKKSMRLLIEKTGFVKAKSG